MYLFVTLLFPINKEYARRIFGFSERDDVVCNEMPVSRELHANVIAEMQIK